jgi:choline dehydrogenase-like flavoprotein
MGTDPKNSVVNERFQLYGFPNIFVADSSIFPAAPGINPALTIMALSRKASQSILQG